MSLASSTGGQFAQSTGGLLSASQQQQLPRVEDQPADKE
jgi:hypothetical protein